VLISKSFGIAPEFDRFVSQDRSLLWPSILDACLAACPKQSLSATDFSLAACICLTRT
jgi:hypothetical protein